MIGREGDLDSLQELLEKQCLQKRRSNNPEGTKEHESHDRTEKKQNSARLATA